MATVKGQARRRRRTTLDTTVARALVPAAARLRSAGVDEPRRDATLLLMDAAGIDRETLIADPDRPLDGEAARRFADHVARRAAREPVSRILGRREFWSLPFGLGPHTFDPRPDSETVVAAVLERIGMRDAPLRILDLGTGSGCLLLALLSELPRARGFGTDIAEETIRVARANAAALGLDGRAGFVVADWGAGLDGSFEIIVCNPPYIPTGVVPTLAPEVARHEPRRALAAGPEGLAAYQALAPDIARLLGPDGIVAIEIGAGQEERVAEILEGAGLMVEARHTDLAHISRCLVGGCRNSRMSRQKKSWNGERTELGSGVGSTIA